MNHQITGFEHVHRHSDYSLLDGLAKVAEYAGRSKEINQKYLCISDHGVLGAVPQQIAESDKHSLFPIFAIEFYINRMQPKVTCREESAEYRKSLGDGSSQATPAQKKFDKSNHLLAIAYNYTGYSNLVRLSSWAWIHGYYRRPRINWEILQQHKEGIVFTSTCANSEIATTFFTQGEDAGMDMVKDYKNTFGEHFYLELMMLDFKDQKPYDAFLIRAHDKFGIPLILSCDCHYCHKEHSHHQRLMLMMKNGRTIQEIQTLIDSGDTDDIFELQDTNLWMKSEDELNEKWESDYHTIIDYELYKQAKVNTVKLCEFAKGVELDRQMKLPIIPNDTDILLENVKRGVVERGIPRTKQYLDRLTEEYNLICEKGFASYFLIQQMMVQEGIRICPELYGFDDPFVARGVGRGSVCGSLIAYCLDLHDVEPIHHDLLFSRFLSPARGGKQMKVRFSIPPLAQ